MKRLVALLIVGLAGAFLAGTVDAGAKDGKMRWSHKKTGECKWFPVLSIPERSDDGPGQKVLKITFKAKELAEFFIIGDGDSDLDVVVKDSKGRIVASDVDAAAEKGGGSDLCMCRWTPTQEEEFTIIIINHGILNYAQAGCN